MNNSEPWNIEPDSVHQERQKRHEDDDVRRISEGWPPFLRKAVQDPFDYAAFVPGIGLVRFEYAEDIGGGWVRLHPCGMRDENVPPLPFTFDRGLEVRLASILWVADAPNGS